MSLFGTRRKTLDEIKREARYPYLEERERALAHIEAQIGDAVKTGLPVCIGLWCGTPVYVGVDLAREPDVSVEAIHDADYGPLPGE